MDKKRDYLLPVSILVAAFLISGAIVYNVGKNSGSEGGKMVANVGEAAGELPVSPAASNVKPVSSDDFILGNPDAPIMIVEFSDLECPYCKVFHSSAKQLVSEYENQVAVVFRHFPLDSIHSKARTEAEATECAGEVGGNEGFWTFLDRLFEVTPSNNGLDLNLLPQIASDVGLDVGEFTACLESGRFAESVENDLQDGISAGGQGTPYSVMIINGEQFVPISGAQPYDSLKIVVEQVLEGLTQ